MKAQLLTYDFKRLIKATGKFIYKEDTRPLLTYIRLEFDKDSKTITAVASNGHTLSTETANCSYIEQNFTAYIKPYMPIGANDPFCIIELSNDRCLIDIGGRMVGYKQPAGEYMEYKQIITDFEALPVLNEIHLSRQYLLDAINSFTSESIKISPVTIQIRESRQPISVKMGKSTRYILPVRNAK